MLSRRHTEHSEKLFSTTVDRNAMSEIKANTLNGILSEFTYITEPLASLRICAKS